MSNQVHNKRPRLLRSLTPPVGLLYHYTGQTTLQRILEGARLLLGPYTKTNDLAESKRWHFSMSGAVTSDREDGTAFWRDTATADRLTRQRASLACLTMDREYDPDNGYGFFHRGWARARMWAQYADGHAGACLVFTKTALGSAITEAVPDGAKLCEGPVTYEDRARSPHLPWGPVDQFGIEAAVTAFVNANWRDMFFHKNTDWASEVEYRYVLVHDGRPLLVPVAPALVAVVLGEGVPESDVSTVSRALASLALDIPVVRCSWFNGGPSLGVPKILPGRQDF